MKNIEDEYHFEATNGELGEPKILILENGEVGGEIVGEVTASQALVAYADHNEWATPKEIFGWLTDIAIDIAETQELKKERKLCSSDKRCGWTWQFNEWLWKVKTGNKEGRII